MGFQGRDYGTTASANGPCRCPCDHASNPRARQRDDKAETVRKPTGTPRSRLLTKARGDRLDGLRTLLQMSRTLSAFGLRGSGQHMQADRLLQFPQGAVYHGCKLCPRNYWVAAPGRARSSDFSNADQVHKWRAGGHHLGGRGHHT